MRNFNIADSIERLEASSLDSQLPFRPLRADLENCFSTLHVSALARFWENNQINLGTLEDQHRRLFTGFQASASTWGFLALAQPSSLSFFFLLPGQDCSGQWSSLFHAVLPGCELLAGPPPLELSKSLFGLEYVAAMTGNPSLPPAVQVENKPAVPRARLESVFRSLQGHHWAYLVIARPVSEDDLANSARNLADEEQELVSSHLRRGTAEEYNNPAAKHCLELLQAAREKYEAGRREGMWDTQTYLFTSDRPQLAHGIHALTGAFGGPNSRPQPLRLRQCRKSDISSPQELPVTRLTTEEIVALACLPAQEFAGYRVKDYVRFAVAPRIPDQTERVSLGVILEDGQETENWFEIGRDQFSKHAFIAGVPGSGKTNTAQFLLRQLWEDHHIPWLVLEPSIKSEYRRLLQSPLGNLLHIFTLGDETGVPFRFNPLEVQPGVQVQTHIDSLAALFSAAFPLFPPMPSVLFLALNRIYAERGWDAAKGNNPRGYSADVQPTLTDLYEAIEQVTRERGYDSEVTANIRAGLQTRLSSLMVGGKGLMFNTPSLVPFSTLLSHPTILEFAALGDDEEKTFLLGAILLRIMQYRQVAGLTGGRLVHITLIEEAHRLLRQVAETVGTETANPRGKAVETFCNMLAESRAYGEGLIVVEQIPTKLAGDVIKNTSFKIIHRLDAEADRKLVGSMMNLRDEQQRFLTSLTPGQAIASAEGWTEGCSVSIPNSARHRGYDQLNPTKDEVTAHMRELLPQAFAVTTAPANTHTAAEDVPACEGCVPGSCQLRQAMLQEILRCKYADFEAALEEGWKGLWGYGETHASAANVPAAAIPDAAYCFLMNVASVCRFDSKAVAMMRKELQILRDRKQSSNL
jgi:DNA helicase HerA-like ATPase